MGEARRRLQYSLRDPRTTISEDEFQFQVEQAERHRMEYGVRAAELIEKALERIAKHVAGIEPDADNYTQQLSDAGLLFQELDLGEGSKANGIYVYLNTGKDILPIAAVLDARLDSDGQIRVDVVWFDRERAETFLSAPTTPTMATCQS